MNLMFYKRITRLLVIIAVFLWGCKSLTAPKSISANQKFLNIYRISIDTTPYFNKTGAGNWNPLAYTLSFDTALTYSNQLWGGTALTSLHQEYSSGRIQFTCITTKFSRSSVTLLLYSNFSSNIQVLSYQYLIISNDYVSDATQIGLYVVSIYVNANLSSLVSCKIDAFLPTPVSEPRAMSTFVTLYGLDASTTSAANIIDLRFSAAFLNQYLARFTIISSSSTPVYLTTIDLTFLYFHNVYYNRASFAGFELLTVQGSNQFQYTNLSNVYDYATLVGVSSFHVQISNYLDFSASFNKPDSISFSSSNLNTNFRYSVLQFFTYYCGPSTPYYWAPNDICMDLCPDRYYGDSSTLTCSKCPYDCFTCSNSNCSSCNTTTDYRTLNATTFRCVPIAGYYQSNATACLSCPTQCYQCTSPTACSSCNSGYYLSSGACLTCSNNCDKCSNSSACNSCMDGYVLASDNQCYTSCSSTYYFSDSNRICVACPTNCSSCVSSSNCTQCLSGSSLINGSCSPCPNSTSCNRCQDNYYLNNDQCVKCPANCDQCNGSSSCNQCNVCKNEPIQSGSSAMPIGIVVGMTIGAIIAAISVLIYKKCKKQGSNNPEKLEYVACSCALRQSAASIQGQFNQQQNEEHAYEGKWYYRKKEITGRKDCSICLSQLAFFRTYCDHSFHLNCLMMWAKKDPRCPYCRLALSQNKHKIYCRRCLSKYKYLSLSKLQQVVRLGKQEQETACWDCQNVPI